MKRILAALMVSLLFLGPSTIMAQSKDESPSRCPCWYSGYEAYLKAPVDKDGKKPQNPPNDPGGPLDQCDMQGKKAEFKDGWSAAQHGDPKKCPYYK